MPFSEHVCWTLDCGDLSPPFRPATCRRTRLRLTVTRDNEQDVMTLTAECAAPGAALESAVAASLQSITKLKGAVKLVAPGTLPNDGKVIADERSVG